MCYVQGIKHFMLTYRQTGCLELIGYSNVDFNCCMDSRKSTIGNIFILASGVMSWRSMNKTLTTTSTMEVKFVSYFEATSHGVWLNSFIVGLRVVDSIQRPSRLYCDNSTAVFVAKN